MPTIAEALNQALACYERAALPQAESICQQILQVDPFHSDALHLLGVIALRREQYETALTWMQKAIAMKPGDSSYHSNLGLVYNNMRRFDEAVASYRQSLVLAPTSHMALNNMGNALREQGKLDEAATCYQNAIRYCPNYPEAHLNLARSWLIKGNFEQGWVELEWRWKQKDTVERTFSQPTWDGSPLQGRSILLYTEGGMGDTLHFVRYAPLVKRMGAGKVIVEGQKRLVPFLSNSPGIDRVVPAGEPSPVTDVQAALLSMPMLLHTTMATVPREVPYLFADAQLIEQWRRKLSEFRGFKIGIAWQGNPQHEKDLMRSVPLELFAPLAGLPGVHLFSLQKGEGSEQLPALQGRFPVIDLASQLDLETGAFMDTAAVMKNLDLVITSDTSIPHLAGGLGVPVWLMLRIVPEWRWLLHGEASPWYPTMRLFRQKTAGDWQEVLRITRELKQKLNR